MDVFFGGPFVVKESPITVGLMCLVALLSTIPGMFSTASVFMFSIDNIEKRKRYWTFLTALFTLPGPEYGFLGFLFLLRCRELERIMGLSRYLELLIFGAVFIGVSHYFAFKYIPGFADKWDVCYGLSWILLLTICTLTRVPLCFRTHIKGLFINDKIPYIILVVLSLLIRMDYAVALANGIGVVLGLLMTLLMVIPFYPISWMIEPCMRGCRKGKTE